MARTPTGSSKAKQSVVPRSVPANAGAAPAKKAGMPKSGAKKQAAPRAPAAQPIASQPIAMQPAVEPIGASKTEAPPPPPAAPVMPLDNASIVAFAGQALQQFSETMRLQADAWATLSRTWLDLMGSRQK